MMKEFNQMLSKLDGDAVRKLHEILGLEVKEVRKVEVGHNLLEFLKDYPDGISQRQAAEALGIGRSRLTTLMVQNRSKIQVIPGMCGSKLIKLKLPSNY